MKEVFQLTVLGARGSMAASRKDCGIFGGDTSCYLVRAGEETIFLDGGSGIASAPPTYPKPPVILLSHLHLDHVMGLGMFTGFFVPGQESRLYVPFCEDDEEAENMMARIFSPPFWPKKLNDLEGEPRILAMPQSFSVGDIRVETMEGNHPDRTVVIRLNYHDHSIVYATDYEVEEPSFSKLADFAAGADLLLFDAQFSEEELPTRRGFGHSTAEKGLELMSRSKAGRMLLIHHAPSSSDRVLLKREKMLNRVNVLYAREGETILL